MPFPMSNTNVSQLYKSVMEDVINNVRETFLDEGVDEQILLELKQIWENKLSQTKAIPAENAHTTTVTTSSSTTTNDQVLATQLTMQSHAAQINAQNKGPRAIGTAVTTQSMPVGAMMHPTLQYHYATTTQGSADGSTKTVTITLPQNPGSGQKPMTITLPAQLVQHAAGGIVMSTPAAAAAQALPPNVAASILQAPLATISTAGVISHPSADGTTISYQAVTAEQLAKHGYMMAPVTTQAMTTTTQASGVIQIDGANDTSDDDDEDDDFKDDDNDPDDNDDGNEDENEGPGEDEVEPLNTEDDVSDEDPSELFDTDNVIVCQYDKITRSRNKWKFHLKDGIMNLQGRDFVFQKASGDAEW